MGEPIQVEPDMADVNGSGRDRKPLKPPRIIPDAAVAKFIARLTAAGVTKDQIQSANLNLQPQYVCAG